MQKLRARVIVPAVAGLAVAGFLAANAWAQQKGAPAAGQDEPVDESSIIKVDVDLVQVLATVHGKNNSLIGNLEKSDFKLFEDGKEQEIKYFTRETDLPLTIGMLIDVSGSMESLIPLEQRAGSEFFNKVLRKQDLAFLISFGKDAELLQDSTSSARSLESGLRELKLNAPVSTLSRNPGPVPTMNNVAGTVLYDAVFLAADEKLKQEVGRKVIILITDGMDEGSKFNRSQAIEAAHRADTAIYGIYYADPRYYGGGFGPSFGGGEGELKKMAEETGGRVFHVDRNNSLDRIFAQIEEEMRSQYAISYSPTNPKKDGTFRKLEFKMSNKDYKVQARKGYYAVKERF